MKYSIKSMASGILMTVAMSTAAHAVTFVDNGATPLSIPFSALYQVNPGSGLAIDGPANVTFTYNGSSAGYNNGFLFNNVQLFSTGGSAVGSTSSVLASAGLLNFAFLSNQVDLLVNGAGGQFGYFMIAFEIISATEANIYLNDNFDDFNFIDMTINAQLSAVPLPAALPLLAAGLLGAGVVSRRRKKKAA